MWKQWIGVRFEFAWGTGGQVACTCLGVGTSVLAGRVFDVCIMDEAGQLTLPVALGPLLRARSFCLLGDHQQLAPLVHSPQAQAAGLDRSLFRILCEAHPEVPLPLRLRQPPPPSCRTATLLFESDASWRGFRGCPDQELVDGEVFALSRLRAGGGRSF